MSSSDQEVSTTIPGISLATSVQITIAMLILNFILCVAIFMLYLRAKYYPVTPSRSRRFIFAPHEPSLPRRALDASVLNSIPIKIFRAEDFKEDGGLECAVCLSELTDGEQARLLPKCNHGFHVECIDMWFNSNSTCPLCRNPVGVDNSINPFVEIPILEAVSNLNEVRSRNAETSSSASAAAAASLVIDIPRRMMNGFSAENSPLPWSAMSLNSPLMTSRLAEKAVKSPGLGRMRSLRRMLSRGKGMGVVSSSSPRFRECDVEQEGASDLKSQ